MSPSTAQTRKLQDSMRTVVISDTITPNCRSVINHSKRGDINDGLRQESNFINALNFNSPFYIHDRGPGVLTTAQLDGNSATHTPILWKGINIQSATNGSMDLSLISMDMFDQLSYTRQGYGEYNSGVIGGAIKLDNEYLLGDRAWGMDISDMQNYRLFTRQAWSDDHSAVQLIGDVSLNKNAYHYIKDKGQFKLDGETTQQDEASNYNWNVLTDFSTVISQEQLLKVSLWLQKSERNIASSKVAKNNNAFQLDDNKRIQFSLRSRKKKYQNDFQLAYLNEYLVYESNVVEKSISDIHSFIISENFQSYLPRWRNFKFTVSMRNDIALTNFFESRKNRLDVSAYGSYRRSFDRFQLYVNSRLNSLDWSLPVFSGEVTLKKEIMKGWISDVSVLRNIRFPNLNDLYWPALGDPNLEKELSHSLQFNNDFRIERRELLVEVDLNLHFQKVSGKILWAPIAGVWRPNNVSAVDLYGYSGKLKFELLRTYQFGIESIFNYAYNRSKIKMSDRPSSIGKELIYNPKIKAGNITRLKLNNTALQFETMYVGDRFTSEDNMNIVEDYWLQNLVFLLDIDKKRRKYQLAIGINNLWDMDYDVVPYYAQPLRNYYIRLKYKY